MWCGGRGLRAVCLVQLRLQVARSCGVVARVRAVVRQDDSPGRWFGGPLGMAEQQDVWAAAPKLGQC
jgi:hypothetical protein